MQHGLSMSDTRKALPVCVCALLVLNAIGAVISVAAEWPTEFDTEGDPEKVLEDLPTRGTLLAAPLSVLIVLVVATALTWLRNRWLASIGLAVLIALCLLFTIGTLGEPLHPEASDPPVAFLIVWKIVVLGVIGSLVALSLIGLYRRWRPATAS